MDETVNLIEKIIEMKLSDLQRSQIKISIAQSLTPVIDKTRNEISSSLFDLIHKINNYD